VIIAVKVEEAVHLLHDKDIVFGDLHSNNILYGASERRVVLIDFDWSGKKGESRYLVTLNRAELGRTWKEEVTSYGVMRKADDLW
jgi:serine/threonine protein kinase